MNPIGWCDSTINVVSGCLNGCDYCYARKMAHRLAGRFGYPADDPFRPVFHPDKLQDIYNLRGAGKRIFLDSMGDWFSLGVDPAWIKAIIGAVAAKPEHTFLVLTKRPDRIPELLNCDEIPKNLWIGVSVTCQDDTHRLDGLREEVPFSHTFVSFEPLHGPISCDLSGIDWVILGKESGNRKGKIETKFEWVENLYHQNNGVRPIYIKDNLRELLQENNLKIVQEFPRSMVI